MKDVQLELVSPVFLAASSPADVETINSYKGNLDYYKERNYTYIPLPLENKYLNADTEEIKDISEAQYIYEDAHVLEAIWDLRGVPFLIEERLPAMEVEHGEGVNSISFGDGDQPPEFVEKSPDLKEEVFNEISWNDKMSIFTLADINKRIVKEGIYPIIGAVEELFSDQIEEYYPHENQRELFSELSPETIGRWEKSKWEGITLHISEYMNISEMIKIIGKNEAMREDIGYTSRTQFDNDIGGIVELRHKIMHVTRTLVHDREDLNDLVRHLSTCLEILENFGADIRIQWYKDQYTGQY